jgi:hypothetical protein
MDPGLRRDDEKGEGRGGLPVMGLSPAHDVPTCRRADVPTCRRADVPRLARAERSVAGPIARFRIPRAMVIAGASCPHPFVSAPNEKGRRDPMSRRPS